MHKLNRPETPEVLINLKRQYPAIDVWSEVKHEERDEIRNALFSMQGHFCAYCERVVTPENGHEEKTGHIEHYRCRSMFPSLTFEWDNLFYSCTNHVSCGKNKDENIPSANINYNELIDPCVDNPEVYFVFTTLGEIKPRENITPIQKARAEETIRVLGLNNIRKDRETVYKTYKFLHTNPANALQIINALEQDGKSPFLTQLYSIFGLRRVS